MWTRQHKPRDTGRLILPTVCVAFVAYFSYHAYNGAYGIDSKHQLDIRKAELTKRLDGIRAQRTHLEHRVDLMRDGSIEKDMLDELVRRALNMSRPDEVTIMLDRQASN